MERFKLSVSVSLFLIKEEKILLIRRFNTGWHDGDYGLPAGHIDGKETVTNAAIREAKEEIGIDIQAENLSVVHVIHKGGDDSEKVDFFLKAEKWNGEPTNMEPDLCDDVNWFPLNELPTNMIPKAKFALEQYLAGKNFSEFGWK